MPTRLKQGRGCGYACHRGDDETWHLLAPLLKCRFLRAYSNSVSGHVDGLKPPVSANVLVVGLGTDPPSRDLASANQTHRVTQVPNAGPRAGSFLTGPRPATIAFARCRLRVAATHVVEYRKAQSGRVQRKRGVRARYQKCCHCVL